MKAPARDPETLLLYDGFVRALARSLVADAHDAEDLAQEAWVAALEGGPRETASLRAWLAAVVRRLSWNLFRREARRRRRECAAARSDRLPSTDEILERETARRRAVEAVLDLEEPYRSTILLRYLENLPPREIAKRLLVPVETVRTRTRRALEQIRARLDREHGGDRAAWCAALAPLAHLLPAVPSGTEVASWESALPKVLAMSTKVKVGAAAALLLGVSLTVWDLTKGPEESATSGSPPTSERKVAAASESAPLPDEVAGESAIPPADRTRRRADAPAGKESRPEEPVSFGSLLVHVVWGEDGKPAAGVGAAVLHEEEPDSYLGTLHVSTGPDGSFRIDRIRTGRVSISLDRGGGTREEIEAGQQTEITLEVPPGVDVAGVVVDSTGRPVPGAEIWLGFQPEGRVVERTGSDGSFRIRSIAEECWVGARAPGYSPSLIDYVVGSKGGTLPVRLVLPGLGGEVVGRVLDSAETPVPGAAVQIGSVDYSLVKLPDGGRGMAPAPVRVHTDAEGRFRASGIGPGSTPIGVRAPGPAFWQGSVEVPVNGRAEVEVRLFEGATLYGTVSDAAGEPAEGVRVSLQGREDLLTPRTETAEDGSFLLESLGPGEIRVLADGGVRGKAWGRFSAPPGTSLRWDATLSAGMVIRGRVVDEDGTPLPGYSIQTRLLTPDAGEWCCTRVEQTDDQGRFVCQNHRDLPHRLYVYLSPEESFPASTLYGIRPGPAEHVIRLPKSARPSAFLVGAVVDAEGKPLGSVEVRPSSPDLDYTRIFTSEEGTGRFRVGPLPPTRWHLQFYPRGLPEVRTEEHLLAAGETVDLGTLRIEPGGTLVVHLGGEGGFGAPVLTVSRWQEPLAVDRGVARSGPLAPGSYLLQVAGEGIASAAYPFEIRSGEESRLEVVLRAGATRRIRFPTSDEERPVRRAHLVVLEESGRVVRDESLSRFDASPFETTIRLAPGTYRVEALAPDGRRAEGSIRVDDVPPSDAVLEFPLR